MAQTSDGREPKTIRGDDARKLLTEQIRAHNDGLLAVLRKYAGRETVRTWHNTIRAIEEFINIPMFGIDDDAILQRLLSMRIDGAFLQEPARTLLAVQSALLPLFEKAIVDRFCQLMVQIAAINMAFRLNGQSNLGSGTTLNTVDDAVSYLQSRRRHFVALLYLMSRVCTGTQKLAPINALNVLLPQVEHSCVTITSMHLQLALLEAEPNFTLELNKVGARASHWLETLDAGFLDPERASVAVMNELRAEQISVSEREAVNPRKIFSAAELRNSIKLLGASYERFGLNDSDFATMATVISKLSARCHDDYVVAIAKPKLRKLLEAQNGMSADEMERLLVNSPSLDYATNTNSFEPFVDLGDVVVSNVNLLSRFLYAFKDIHLGSRRRFQIHAGFIFEDMVARDLKDLGFKVTGIKRINGKEFDVVTTLGDTIYNFQCKNNWVDLTRIEADRTLFVRYNRALTNYYAKALIKEERRENLLKKKLGLTKVEHYVISRFPVITDNNRILPYNKISKMAEFVDAEIAAPP